MRKYVLVPKEFVEKAELAAVILDEQSGEGSDVFSAQAAEAVHKSILSVNEENWKNREIPESVLARLDKVLLEEGVAW